MPYQFNTADDQRKMLAAIGVSSLEELFAVIPAELRLKRELDLPPALGELALTQHMQGLAGSNLAAGLSCSFLGAGSYDHFIPAAVDALASRGEFYTSYTPYQPEVSQGNLQAMFEYQTLVCELTGMDVSNASLYDGGSAVAEAALMSISCTKRHGQVVVSRTMHPEYREILETYVQNLGTRVSTVPRDGGCLDLCQLERTLDQQTACVLIQHPNFFGCIEDVRKVADLTHRHGALLVVACDPISLGRLKRPGDMGADIVVAEGQSLGSPLNFGGPYLGILACREAFIRRMPGRIAGQTVDRRNRRCWVLTLQTREQHIRRDKATSNICTNQGLFALRASIYLSLMGPSGLRGVADLCLQKAHYAAAEIAKLDRFELPLGQAFFKEFVVRDRENHVEELLAAAAEEDLLAGVPLGTWYADLSDCFLVAVTEKRTKQDIDRLVRFLSHSRSSHAGVPNYA